MAEVFRGQVVGAEGFRRPVAIKRVLPGMSSDEAFADMFVREAKIAALLTHPNITSVIDFDRDAEGRLFIAMELVDGRDLREVMRKGPVPASVAINIVTDMLRALAYAHDLEHEGRAMQLVHRDVTPHNIIIGWNRTAKLTDFGIAKAFAESPLTKTGIIKGKVAYLSPEQASAEPLDGRSDLFAVGIILWELISGKRLFANAANDAVVMHNIVTVDAPDLSTVGSVSPALAAVCNKLLVRDRSKRTGSAGEALSALLDCPETTPSGPMEVASFLRTLFPKPGETPRAHVPVGQPLGDFTQVQPVASDESDVALPTMPDEPTVVPTHATAEIPTEAGGAAYTPEPRLWVPADIGVNAMLQPYPPPMPPVVRRRRWWLAPLLLSPLVVVLVLSLGRRAVEQRTAPVEMPAPTPAARVVVQPREVVPTAGEVVVEVPRPRRAPRRRDPTAKVVAEPEPQKVAERVVDPRAIRRRVRALGDRIRKHGGELPEDVGAKIDLRYLDIESAARSALTGEQWKELDEQIRALDKSVGEAMRP